MIEYNIGGKIFLKKGGRYYPKAQGGLQTGMNWTALEGTDAGDSIGNNQARKNQKETASTYNTYLSGAGNILGSLNRNDNAGTSRRANIQRDKYDSSGFNKGVGAITGVAAMVDPTGISAIINGGLKLQSGIDKAIDAKDEYGISKNKAAMMAANVLNPWGHVGESFKIGKEKGFGEGVKNFFTLGNSGNKLARQDVQTALNRDKEDEMRMRQGVNTGEYRNDSVYAQTGAHIKPKPAYDEEPNVEIEDGEIVLADPRTISVHGNAGTSLESKYGAMFHGDKHGKDTDKDGMEGIPLTSGEAYVASAYLGLDGKKAGPGNKSVASEMKPYLEYLHRSEKNSNDPYSNNPVGIAQTNEQLHSLKREAEKGKFAEELRKLTTKKDRDVNEILQFVATQAPIEDLNETEQQSVAQVQQMLNQNQQPQNQQQMNPFFMRGGKLYRQMGGPMEQPGAPAQDPSAMAMQQLAAQAPGMGDPAMQGAPQGPPQGAPQGGLSPEAQQILQQLPPEVQQQIMQLPPEQQEQAVMQAAEQMGMAGGAPQGGAPVEMAEEAAMGMEGGQPVMQCGGMTKRKYRNGDYIKYKAGGRIHEGRIANMTSNGFDLR